MFDAGAQRGPSPRLLGAVAGAPDDVVKNAPYSAEITAETTQAISGGNRIRQTSKGKMYRDADGRVRNELALAGLGVLAPPGTLPEVVFITDPVAGVNYALNGRDKTATKTVWAPTQQKGGKADASSAGRSGGRQTGGRAVAKAGADVKTEALGKQTIEGLSAEGTRTTLTIPAGEVGNEQPIHVVSESWYSADLQQVILSKHSDPRFGETVVRVTNIARGNCSPALFQPPADYKIRESLRDSGGRDNSRN